MALLEPKRRFLAIALAFLVRICWTGFATRVKPLAKLSMGFGESPAYFH
jgi:hypothetical protein